MRQITVDGRPEAKDVKLLGLRFSNAYRFDLHTDSITEKIASRTGQLSKLVGWADQETMETLANATILPVANYGASIYASDKANINRVQIKINKCMRLITNSKLSRHVADMIKELNWMKFTDMVDHAKVMLLHKILVTSAAPYCKMLVENASNRTRYATREVELKIAWRPKLARKGCKSFLVTSVKLYNQVKLIGKMMKHSAISKYTKATLLAWNKK